MGRKDSYAESLATSRGSAREGEFSLNGLLGFGLYGKTVGVIGTGTIGRVFSGIMGGLRHADARP